MQISKTNIKPLRPVYFKNTLQGQGRSDESFQSIFEQKMYQQHSKIPTKPRAEFTGILNSCNVSRMNSQTCHFLLETLDSDLMLRTEGYLLSLAKKHLWDEVRVRGYFDESGDVLNVESIIPVHFNDETPPYLNDSDWEIEKFRKQIQKEHLIEPRLDLLAC